MVDYRSKARKYLQAANERLEAENDELRYAALDLRHAIEALTYDRAKAYKGELPPETYDTWQPKKLMAALLEIDPTADKDSTISFGVEETYGVPPPVMKTLGTDTVFNLKLLRKHYDALGSYLHVQTLKQAQKGPLSSEKLRQRCVEIRDYLVKVLSSPVWNSTLGNFVTFKCHLCSKIIRKRMPIGMKEVISECFECDASHKIKDVGEGNVEITPELIPFRCGNSTCAYTVDLFRREIILGRAWNCPNCGGQNVLRLGVSYTPAAEPDTGA